MTDQDDLDLTQAFQQLTAPASTASYAQRTPAMDVTPTGRRWPQALAGVVAVLVAIAGAGTFLALRNARDRGVATTSGGNPPARTGAVMAYDSSASVTVMYGGLGAAGTALHDTWVWDGSRWATATRPAGPGPLVNAHLSDDPADGGVLLVGIPAPPTSAPGTVTGCAIGSTGAGSATGSSASSAPASSAPGAPGSASGAPSAYSSAQASAAPTAAVTGPASNPPLSSCPPVVAPASAQTWVFDAQGWHRVDAAAGATMPPADAQLAYDAASGQVLAVAAVYYPCGGPLSSGTTKQPLIPCEAGPARGAASSAGAPQVCTVTSCPVPTALCPLAAEGAVYSCGGATTSTWTWAGGHWRARPNAGPADFVNTIALYGDRDNAHATLVGVQPSLVGCPTPCQISTVKTWQWTGSTWSPSQTSPPAVAPELGGASVVGLSNVVVAITNNGQTWTWSGGSWRESSGVAATARTGAAIAAGPGNTVVLFGGAAAPSSGIAEAGRAAIGSDTWVWRNGAWRLAGGTVPPPPTTCPTVSSAGPACVEILPAQVPPATSPSPSPTPAGNGTVAP